MIKLSLASVSALVLAILLSGCSSAPSSANPDGPDTETPQPETPEPEAPDSDDELAEMRDAAALMSGRVDAMEVTSASAMPQSGQATYMGYGGLLLDTPGGATTLLGEATLTTDFAEGWISGRVDDIFSGNSDADAVEYDGRIRLRGDLGVLDPNGFDLEVEGDIEGGGQQIEITGTASGDFYGPNGEALGLSADDDTLEFSVDGDTVNGSLVVVAED